jgi:flagellar assembly protein FliH
MTKKSLRTPGQKFFFDVNIFDEGYIDPSIPVEPLPPVYSQQDLQSSQQQAFERGRQQGLKEAAESREQTVAQILGKIAHDMGRLFSAEDAREQLYEDEALRLASAILEKLFPALHDKYGMDELKPAIASVLATREGQTEVLIEVHENDLAEITQQLENLTAPSGQAIRYTVRVRAGLQPHACRITWKDGGAVRDSQALAVEIGAIIQETLAAHGGSSHNRDNSDEASLMLEKQEE